MTITPKLHMLEEHVCPFLRQWHMGLGFYGEQGIEGIHSECNTRSHHFNHVKKKDTRLRQILVNHHIHDFRGSYYNIGREFPRRLFDPLLQYDFIVSAVVSF